MSSKQTILSILATTGVLTMGGSALMGYTLEPPNFKDGVTVLNYVPPSRTPEAFPAASGDSGPGGVSEEIRQELRNKELF